MARVLIVDDEQGFRRSIQQFLKKEGHKVAAADSAEKALEILKEREFDVVVTDIVMPRVNGMDLLKSIKESRPNIPVIIMTGEPTVDTAIKAVQAEAFDYLVKPFSREDICKTVRNAANQKALEDENRQYREHMEELVDKRGRDLRKSEKRYRLLAENSKDAIWLMELGGRFSYISPYVERMTGFSPEEIMSLPPEGFLAPGSMAKIEKLLADQLALPRENREESVRLEQRQRRKDGSELDIEINANWVLDEEGNPIAIQGVSRDITERKKAEEALHESEQQYRTLADAAFEGIVITKRGKVLAANRRSAEILGYEPDELIGRKAVEFVYPEDRELVAQNIQMGNDGPYQHRSLRKDGSVILLEIQARKTTYEGREVRITAITDITDRKKASEKLKKWANIFEHAGWGVAVSSQDGKSHELMNPAYAKMHGYTVEELSGKPVSDAYTPQGRKEIPELIRQVNEKGHHSFEADHVRKDGSVFPALVNANAVKDKNGNFLYRIVNVQDITERRRTEERAVGLSKIFETSLNEIYIFDVSTLKFIEVNRGARENLGYTIDELCEMTPLDIKPHFTPELFAETIVPLQTGEKKIVRFETTHERKDGSLYDVEVHLQLSSFSKSSVFVAIILDITDRKLAEEKLRESESRYRTILDRISEGYFEVDLAGAFTFFNEAMRDILGYAENEMIGLNNQKYMDKDNTKKVFEIFNEVYRTGDPAKASNWQLIRRDGSKRLIETSVILKKNSMGKPIGFRGVARDITKRKQAEEALARREHYYRTLMHSMHEEILVIDKDFRITDINNTFLITTGRSRPEVLGKHCFEISHGYESPCSEHGERCVLKGVFETGEPAQCLHEHKRKDGASAFVDILVSPVKDEKGNVTHVVEAIRDISDLMKTQRELQNSEELYRLLADNVADTIWIVGLSDMRFSYISPAVEKILGYTPAEVLELELSDFMTPETLENIALTISEELALENEEGAAPGKSRVQELEQVRKDGSIIWTEITARFLRDDDGRPDRILGVTRDITERKQAEEALRESEIKFREMTEKVSDVLFQTDISGVITYLSPSSKEVFGLTPEEMTGHEFTEFLLESEKEHAMLEYSKALISGRTRNNFIVKMKRSDGEIFWGELNTSIQVRDGEAAGTLGIIRDITDRMRAEEALMASEKNYRNIFHTINDAIIIHDIETGAILDVNSIMGKMWGYTREESLRIDIDALSHGEPPYSQQDGERWLHLAATEGPQAFEWLARRKNGELFWLEVKLQTVVIAGQQRIMAVDRDITERKQAEEEKEKLEGQLRQAHKMEAVGRLAGGVAHDFNNILTGINGYAEMIIEGLDADDSLRPNMEVILSSGKRAAGLTAQLLAFSRKQIIAPRVIQPNDILLNSQKMLRRIIGEDIDFVFAPDGRLWRINADPTQLDQVLMNLAVNARDAMPDGGKLTIETQNVTLDDEYCKSHAGFIPGDYVMLAVTDTGHGMDAETLENIFEPFFSTKEVGKGTGLGLAMVYGVMKQNKGFINVYSEIGEGTTFKIYYPALKEKAEKLSKDKLADMPAGTETVLLVEDEGIVRNLAKTVLERQGYTVIDAPDGKKARLEYTQYSGEIHLLLTDVVMPKMNGGELYKKLLDLKPGLKALFMSGYTEDAIAHHGVLDKGAHFIQKPFTIQALAKAVRKALDT
jgi:PAS domain S-box-containing protein